jgi:hypothetical protein
MGGPNKPGTICTGWKAIVVSCNDVLTTPTATQIVDHDEYGVTQHCWEKPNPKANVCKKS